MLSAIDVVNLVKNIRPNDKVYPLEYPVDSPDLAIVVTVTNSSKATAGMYPLHVQVKVRSEHPSKAETTCLSIRTALEELRDIRVGNVQIVFIEPTNPFPIYIGKDGNANYLFSNNYRFIINEEV
jgi:hypothetical protein